MSIEYRKLKPEESTQYRAVRLESLEKFPDAFGASYEDEARKPRLFFEKLVAQPIPDKFMYGAFDGDQLIGICGFIKEEQQRSSHRGIIIQMYVKASYTGRQIGQQLLAAVLDEAFKLPGLEMITLGVISDNLAARRIYQKLGFVTYGFLEKFYKNEQNYLHHDFMVLHKK